jgi:KipI family sensor histidine kinase inhibitor
LTLYPRVRPVGDAALTVELGDAILPRLNAAVRALDRSLAEDPLSGVTEAIPTYRSLLVCYDPDRTSFAALAEALLDRATLDGSLLPPGPLRTIPTVYGGDDGPDLSDVAKARGLQEDDVIRLHTSLEFTAFMLGFLPGFAYLGLLPESLALPRRATPRRRVPGGSVAIAGKQTGIYPRASPGGWHLIGRTSARMFDAAQDPPSLIEPGDRVRFARVQELSEESRAPTTPGTIGGGSVEVTAPGLLTTVQATRRRGHRRRGVGDSGPLDAIAHAAANRAVGNAAGDAALEVTLVGPTLRFLQSTRVAIAGADLGAVLERSDLGAWEVSLGQAFLARPQNVLRFLGRRAGCRAYVAFAGGIETPVILGSRSTDLTGGFGGHQGRALLEGDVLTVGRGEGGESAQPSALPSAEDTGVTTLRVILGPQEGHFAPEVLHGFLHETYSLTVDSDRVGCRLNGPAIVASGPSEIVSDGMVPGSIQVPPDGQPIVMLADGPTTGGYPKIATVMTADLGRLAQLVPGEGRVRFEAVELRRA